MVMVLVGGLPRYRCSHFGKMSSTVVGLPPQKIHVGVDAIAMTEWGCHAAQAETAERGTNAKDRDRFGNPHPQPPRLHGQHAEDHQDSQEAHLVSPHNSDYQRRVAIASNTAKMADRRN